MRSERGAAAAEFALVAGLMVTLFFAMLEFGMLLDEQLAVAAAARSGARLAAVEGGDTQEVRAAIDRELQGFGVDPQRVTITIGPHHAIYGTPITVTLTEPYTFHTPLMRGLGVQALQLRARATSRSERLASPNG